MPNEQQNEKKARNENETIQILPHVLLVKRSEFTIVNQIGHKTFFERAFTKLK